MAEKDTQRPSVSGTSSSLQTAAPSAGPSTSKQTTLVARGTGPKPRPENYKPLHSEVLEFVSIKYPPLNALFSPNKNNKGKIDWNDLAMLGVRYVSWGIF